ncbi:MAG: dihydropteroate synthase [Bacillota bacterium]
MLVIGERINSSRKAIAEMLKNKDGVALVREAMAQRKAGAAYIDVNAATMMELEPEYLKWLVLILNEHLDVPLCIDTPNPAAMEVALRTHKGRAMLNSISAESERFNDVLALVREYRPRVVALCLGDEGMPESVDDRLRVVDRLLPALLDAGITSEDIFFDPLVKPVSSGSTYGLEVLHTISAIKSRFPGVRTVCGLSNVSYGLPVRKLLNRAFMVMTVAAGIDALIIDPLDKALMSLLHASEVLVGHDEYAMEYLRAYREGHLEA